MAFGKEQFEEILITAITGLTKKVEIMGQDISDMKIIMGITTSRVSSVEQYISELKASNCETNSSINRLQAQQEFFETDNSILRKDVEELIRTADKSNIAKSLNLSDVSADTTIEGDLVSFSLDEEPISHFITFR